jgi:CheY-like chemotaxis protein
METHNDSSQNTTQDQKVLLTGDFWHQDFQRIVSNFNVPVTLVPIDKIESVSDGHFDLIVVAQSRRDQFQSVDIEKIIEMFANVPVVALLGSWCEGEVRSGEPFPGVMRIYWHQWNGRYEDFLNQLNGHGVTHWHSPRTSSIADRIALRDQIRLPNNKSKPNIELVSISAWTQESYEMLADAVNHFGWQSRWVERAFWDAEATQAVSLICIDARAWSDDVKNRIKWIRSELQQIPMILVVSYPRANELDAIEAAGITEVVSKPFELNDLKSAMIRAVEKNNQVKTSAS